MVKKKGKSKRTSFKDKYKIERRVAETHRKRKKQAKKDLKAGKVIPKKKDPGIPNSWPFKQDLLKSIQRQREREQQKEVELKEKRKADLKLLRDHQASGGTARTVQELMARAHQDQADFEEKVETTELSDGTVAAGQASRRAYLRELKKVVDGADILLQVLDARDPMGSRIHPTIEETILAQADKRMVLVLNKIDLVPKQVVADWLTFLRRSHPTIAVKASQERGNAEEIQVDANSTSVPVGMDGLLQLLKNYARTGGVGGKTKTTIVVGILGYPNVGKSSIINALKRTRAVGVSSRPGSTSSMQEVVLDRNVRLLDSPGVVFNDHSTLLGGVDSESMDDPIPPVEAILQRCDHNSLLMTYNIPTFPPGNVMVFLAMVAKAHGRVLKGGIPDKVAAARTVLRDWNTGKIPFYTPAPTVDVTMGADSNNSKKTAVIVSQMDKEINLQKLDEEVMNSLKDTDEMDFVQLKEDKAERTMDMDAVKILKGEQASSSSSDDDEEEDDEMDVEAGGKVSREKLKDAEDYDFEDM